MCKCQVVRHDWKLTRQVTDKTTAPDPQVCYSCVPLIFFFFSIKTEKISFCFFPSPELPQPQSCLASVQEPQRLCRHQRSFPKQVSLEHNEIKCLHARTNTARTVSTLWGGKVNRALTTFSVQLGNKSPSNYKVQSVKQRVDVFSLARLCPTLNSLWRFYSQSCFFFFFNLEATNHWKKCLRFSAKMRNWQVMKWPRM